MSSSHVSKIVILLSSPWLGQSPGKNKREDVPGKPLSFHFKATHRTKTSAWNAPQHRKFRYWLRQCGLAAVPSIA